MLSRALSYERCLPWFPSVFSCIHSPPRVFGYPWSPSPCSAGWKCSSGSKAHSRCFLTLGERCPCCLMSSVWRAVFFLHFVLSCFRWGGSIHPCNSTLPVISVGCRTPSHLSVFPWFQDLSIYQLPPQLQHLLAFS